MENSKVTIKLTYPELNEVISKMANELEIYQDEASHNLISAFTKLVVAADDGVHRTSNVNRWIGKLEIYKNQ